LNSKKVIGAPLNLVLSKEPDQTATLFKQSDLMTIDPLAVPSHVAIIMDGNRRWAKSRGLPHFSGYEKGVEIIRTTVQAAKEIGIKTLTLFAFSTENWNRSEREVDFLMYMFRTYCEHEKEHMVRGGVRFETIGDLSRLPREVFDSLERTKRATEHGRELDLVIAVNYGGRDEIRRAMLGILRDFKRGKISEEMLSEELIGRYMDTARWRDPQLLIRTSGEHRLSNFLLWQLSYAEVFVTDVLWPDFSEWDFMHAIREYQMRQRRWGI
jgi:undecaprenyl diphosphate synthase